MDISLSKLLNVIGQALLVPCLIVLILLMIVTVWQVGDLLLEAWLERKQRKVDGAALIRKLKESTLTDLPDLIRQSLLPKGHKQALILLTESADYSKESLSALASRLLATEEAHYTRTLRVTDMVCKLGPMFGLLGTLIPLGPGIVALGYGDTATLSASMSVAFDTTIAGLISAAICYVISSIRKRWYDNNMVTLETLMECIIEGGFVDAAQ